MEQKYKHPEHLDILEAIYELYIQEGDVPTKAIFTLVMWSVGDSLRGRGFTISDNLLWQRLYEYNKTIEVTKVEDTLPGTFVNFEQVVKVYWLCQHDTQAMKNWKEKEQPLMFQMGNGN